MLDEKEVSVRVALSALQLSFCAALALVSGCAHGPILLGVTPLLSKQEAARSEHKKGHAGDDAAHDPHDNGLATGTWDWVFRSNDEGGNVRVEQEEWHLLQKGQTVEGYYDRAVTLLSTDDRLFKCNQQLGYTRFTRVRIGGSVEHGRVKMRELAFDAHPGPCDDGARSLTTYDGELSSATMKLTWAAHLGQQTLFRRQSDSGPHLAEMVGIEATAPDPGLTGTGDHSSAAVSGDWEWLLKSVDAEGDERVEREEWHLVEGSGGITGYYERKVVRMREGGVFQCNNDNSYETTTRYEIEGHRLGEVVTLTETAFQATHSKCDNGLRRLDTYQGSVSGTGEELVLSWGAGNQVLRRRKDQHVSQVDPAGPADTVEPALRATTVLHVRR